MNYLKTAFCALIILTGCSKEEPTVAKEENPLSVKGVYILNEGGFTKSNSSLTMIVPDSGKVYSDVFFAANNRGIGDVANDIVLYDKKAFIVVNNSHRIEVISTETHKLLGTINVPGNSPNKIVIANASKGYITNLYKGTVTVFNPTTFAVITSDIPVGMNPQGMAVTGGKLFVCNSGYGSDSTVSVIDVAKDSVIAVITTAKSPTDIAVDSDGDVIVLCNGYTDFVNSANDTPGSIAVIDPVLHTVKTTINLPLASYGHPGELTLSGTGYGFTVVKNGLLKFDTRTNAIVNSSFIQRTGYSIAVDNVSERIYIGDAKDYNSNGTIYIYEKSGVLKDSADVGIVPGTIVFKH
jgi:YVTN family beta-propeller protein